MWNLKWDITPCFLQLQPRKWHVYLMKEGTWRFFDDGLAHFSIFYFLSLSCSKASEVSTFSKSFKKTQPPSTHFLVVINRVSKAWIHCSPRFQSFQCVIWLNWQWGCCGEKCFGRFRNNFVFFMLKFLWKHNVLWKFYWLIGVVKYSRDLLLISGLWLPNTGPLWDSLREGEECFLRLKCHFY